MAKHPTNKYDYSDPEVLKGLLGKHYMSDEKRKKYDYSDPEVLKGLLGKHYMSDEKRKELEEKTASGELVVISDDDPFRPYYPPVSLEKSQADLRQRIKEMKEAGVLADDNIFMDDNIKY